MKAKSKKPTPSPKTYNSKVFEVTDDEDLSKSNKMRRLYDLGVESPMEISKLLSCHYSFVYGVLSRYKDKK